MLSAAPCCEASKPKLCPLASCRLRDTSVPCFGLRSVPSVLGGRRRSRRPTLVPSACTLPSLGAEVTPPPPYQSALGPPAPFLPLSPFFCCTESRRAGAGNSSSSVSEPILFPVLCQNLFCFPTQGVGARPRPAARGSGDVVCFFYHNDEVFIATIAPQSTNFTDLSPSF